MHLKWFFKQFFSQFNWHPVSQPNSLENSLRESIFREDLALYNYLQATALNKRLKDIMDKQKANSKFGKAGGAGNTGAGGLAGAGERLRNWINEEMDVIGTVKKATATGTTSRPQARVATRRRSGSRASGR